MRYLPVVLLCSSMYAAHVDVIEEIVCKVNGDIITRNDLDKARKQGEEELRRNNVAGSRLQEMLDARMPDILRDKIDNLLMIQRAKELDLKVDSDLNKRLAEIQRRSGIADPQKFQEWVKTQVGEPYEDYRGDLKNQLLVEGVIREEIARKITFKREELEAYYNDHKADYQRQERIFLREILISTAGKDEAAVAAAEKKAKDISQRAKKGEKFADLAQTNSDDSNTAQDGGALPPLEKSQLDTQIAASVWDQPRSYVSDPIKRDNGFLILRVDEHYKAGLASFDEVENEVQNRMMETRLGPAERDYLTKLRQNAFLEIKPGYKDAGAAPGKDTAWMDPAELKPETVTKEELAKAGKKKKLLKLIPVPGTAVDQTGTSSSR
jgi:peptidyl-prolyl cis-trans isomerase SurA